MLRTLLASLAFLTGSILHASMPLTSGLLHEKGFLDRPFKSMRVVSFNLFRGDTVLDTNPVYVGLSRLYPDLPIEVQTYFNDVLKPRPHVRFRRPQIDHILSSRFLMSYFTQSSLRSKLQFQRAARALAEETLVGQNPNEPVLMFFNSFAIWCLIRESLEREQLVPYYKIHQAHKKFWQNYLDFREMVEDEIARNLPPGSLLITGDLLSQPHLRVYDKAPSIKFTDYEFKVPESTSYYETSSLIMREGFGTDGLDLEQEQFYIRFAEEADFIQLRKTAFSNPGREFIVLNFNTLGAFKLRALSRHQATLAASLIRFVRTSYPDLNIWITPPDLPRGTTPDVLPQLEEQHRLLRAFVNSPENQGVVAFLPEENKFLWGNAVRAANCAVSQDGGFLHMCNLMSPHTPHRILSYSYDSAARMWAKSAQPIVENLQSTSELHEHRRFWWSKPRNTLELNQSAVFELKFWLRNMLGYSQQADEILEKESLTLLTKTPLLERARATFQVIKHFDHLTDAHKREIMSVANELFSALRNGKKSSLNTVSLKSLIHLMAAGLYIPEYKELLEPLWSYLWKTSLGYDQLSTQLRSNEPLSLLPELAEQFLKLDKLELFGGQSIRKSQFLSMQKEIRELLTSYQQAASCNRVLAEALQD